MPDTSTVPQGTGAAGTAGLAATIPIYYKRQTLDWVKASLRYDNFGMPDSIPLRNGTQLIWTRYDVMATSAAPTALTEGVTPASAAMSSTNITATMAEYGTYTLKSTYLLKTAFDEQINQASKQLSYKASRDIDSLCRDMLSAGLVSGSGGNYIVAGNLTAASGLAEVANTNVIQAVDMLASQTKLHNAAAPPFFSNGDYGAVLASPCLYDLRSDTSAGGWIDINKYNNQNVIINGESGKVHGVRITDTQNYYSTSTGTSASGSAFFNYVFGEGSFGTVKLGMEDVDMIIKLAEKSGTEDPLNQRNSIGFTFRYDCQDLKTSLTSDVHRRVTLLAASAARSL